MPKPEEFLAIVSGRRRGFRAGLWRAALRLAETPYTWGVRWRNRRYDKAASRSTAVDVPVISVGNLTLGGTGKTPAVEWIARWLRQHDVRVTIVSRGYGAEDGARNDEALELEQKLPDVPHLQNPNRVAAAQTAIEEFETQCILLDDGFQHRRLRRDLDIVLLDALEPFGYRHVFPRGLLREPLAGLRRADVVILSRADAVSEKTRAAIRDEVRRHAPRAAWLEAAHQPQSLLAASGTEEPLESVREAVARGERIGAFCGIGNPAGFQHTLNELGANVAAFREFPDHHAYSRRDVDELAAWAKAEDLKRLLCTHKDLVKLGVDRVGPAVLRAVRIGLHFLQGPASGAAALESRLEKLVARIAAPAEPGG